MKLKLVQIVENLVAINPNGVDGRCHFCQRRTGNSIEKHGTKCPWTYAKRYLGGKQWAE